VIARGDIFSVQNVLPYKILLLEGQDGKVWKNHEQILHHVTFRVQMVKWIQPWQ
jgi:hypothetical protein